MGKVREKVRISICEMGHYSLDLNKKFCAKHGTPMIINCKNPECNKPIEIDISGSDIPNFCEYCGKVILKK